MWSGLTDGCGNPNSSSYLTCYPPAVNYDPRYYLVNGVAFDRGGGRDRRLARQPAHRQAASPATYWCGS